MSLTINLTQLKRKKRKNGTVPIYIRITEGGKSRYKSTGISVFRKDWNPDRQEVRKSHRRYQPLNRQLRQKVRAIEEIRDDLEKKDKLSISNLKRRINNNGNDDTNNSPPLIQKSRDYRNYLDNENRYWEHRHFKVIIGNLERFIKEKDQSISLSQIDAKWIEGFQAFLLSEGDPINKDGSKTGNNVHSLA